MAKAVTAITKALGKLTPEAQIEVLPMLEAVLIDALISVSADTHMSDSQKSGATQFGSKSIESVRALIMSLSHVTPTPSKRVIYTTPES